MYLLLRHKIAGIEITPKMSAKEFHSQPDFQRIVYSECVSESPSQINYLRFIRDDNKYLLPDTVDFTKCPIPSLFFVCVDISEERKC